MKQIPFQKLTPYFIGIILFFLITLVYFNPLLTGKRINQVDVVHHKGASKEIADYRNETGKEALWTNAIFGGMPAYQISVLYTNNLLIYINKFLQFGLPNPAGIALIYFIGFFLLLIVLGVNPWLSIVGALAFGFSSYFFIILEAGHNTKALAIAYMAPVLAGIILAYRGKYIWGGVLTALFLGLEIKANHLQITYYLLLIVLIYGIFEFVNTIKQKSYKPFLIATSVLILAALFGVMTNITSLWTTYEYTKVTIRGKSELTSNKDNKTSGLNKDYATQWSYGIGESFSLIIPNTKGGASGYLGENKKVLNKLDPQVHQLVGQQSHYWGDQPFTSGPVYVGAVIIFFFIFGLFIVKGRLKWILLTATILSLLLSWGKNFMPLTEFFLEYFPLYNKFRAVSMILVIAEFCIPLLAILAVNEILKNPEIIKQNFKKLLITLGVAGGLTFVFYIIPTVFFSFFSQMELAQYTQYRLGENAASYVPIIDGIEQARISIFRSDALRSLMFILLAFGTIYLYHLKKIKASLFLLGLGVLIVVDLIPVCYRYLDNDDYVRKSKMKRPFQASFADKEILKDKAENYRVYNFATNTFNESATSYFHKTIGGYHGAKLRRYQDLIDYHIMSERESFMSTLRNSPTLESISETLSRSSVLNMLNTKYFIFDPSRQPMLNQYALGNAWLVSDVRLVEDADKEIAALKIINPAKTAVVDERFASLVETNFIRDPLSKIKLTSYEPNHLLYRSVSSSDQLAVFSEIYYEKGWKAFIDGKRVPHLRANYVLRALPIPAGEHQIEFKFEPSSYFIGRKISLFSSLLVILLFVGVLGFEIKKFLAEK